MMSLIPLLQDDFFDYLWNHSYGPRSNHNVDLYRPLGLLPPEYYGRGPIAETRNGKSLKKKKNADDEDQFQVHLNVRDFAPEEIKIFTDKNQIIVEGQHEEKKDGDGLIWRHFIRKYLMPEGHDLDKIVCNLSSHGILSVTAPKKGKQIKGPIQIPITRADAVQHQQNGHSLK